MNQQHNEIDFIDLVRILWKRKLVVSLFTLLFATVAVVYSFSAKEQWSSSAEVTSPRVTDVSEYLSLRKEYSLIIGKEFNATEIMDSLFETFSRYALSLDERETFFSEEKYYQDLFWGVSEEKKKIILSELAKEKLSITKPDSKKEPNSIGVLYKFISETPALAQKILSDFINKMSQVAFNQHKDEFIYWLKERIATLDYEKLIIERDLPIKREFRVQNLSNALETAKKAGIKEYSVSVSGSSLNNLAVSDTRISLSDSKSADDTYLFMLGQKYLQAQLDIAISTPEIYPPRYYQIKDELDKVNAILSKIGNVKGEAFSYVSFPDEPVQRDWPKRFLLLIIGAVFGGALGSAFVLVKSLFSKNYE